MALDSGMNWATRWGPEVQVLAAKIDLNQRLLRFGITPVTRDNLRHVLPILSQHLVGITSRFYDFMRRFPEAQRVFDRHDTDRLRKRQQEHWYGLLACEFDQAYLLNALGVGHAHYHAKVPPSLYMAGYNFVVTDLLRLVAVEFKGGDIAAASASISRVVMLDMSLALTAFMLDSLISAAPGQD